MATKGFFSIWNHHKRLSQFFPLHFNTYVMGSMAIINLSLFQRGDRFSRQILTSINVAFWRLQSIPVLKGLIKNTVLELNPHGQLKTGTQNCNIKWSLCPPPPLRSHVIWCKQLNRGGLNAGPMFQTFNQHSASIGLICLVYCTLSPEQKTPHIKPMLAWCWASVADGGPTSKHNWFKFRLCSVWDFTNNIKITNDTDEWDLRLHISC